MKHILCALLVVLWFVHCLDAEEILAFIEVKEREREQIISAAFSPDGKTFVVHGWENVGMPSNVAGPQMGIFFRILDADTGKELQHFRGMAAASVCSAVFSPDGKRIVIPPSRDETCVRVYDVESGKELLRLDRTNTVNLARFSSDGKKIVTANRDRIVQLWDAETGREVHRFKKLLEPAQNIAFSPNGKKIMATFWNPQNRNDFTVHIWDVDSGKELQKLELELERYFRPATFSPDGKKIITNTYKPHGMIHIVRLWDIELGKELHKMERHNSGIFSPDGTRMMMEETRFFGVHVGHYVRIIDADSGEELYELKMDNFIDSFAFSPDGTMVVIANRGSVDVWSADLANHRLEIMSLGENRLARPVSFSPNGKKIMVVDRNHSATTSADRAPVVRVFDFEDLLRRAMHRRPAIMDF
jgi:WD40 repeat protein